MENVDRRAFRLLPSEEVLWTGAPEPGVPRERPFVWVPVLLFSIAQVAILFGMLLSSEGLPGVRDAFALGVLFAALGGALLLLPSRIFGEEAYVVTDRRVVLRRGQTVRSMERRAIQLGRVRWHRSASAVGDLELVIPVPFGPLRRQQRVVLRVVRDPDRVFALIRGVEAPPHPGDADLPLIDRLDVGERVLWGGHPEGSPFGLREIITTGAGVALSALSVAYGHRVALIVIGLSARREPIGDDQLALLFTAVAISTILMMAVSAFLIWHGLIRARSLGRQTEYMLTDHRLLIRRGKVELSVDRRLIFDVALTPLRGGGELAHLYLVLDTPDGRALADSGAMGLVPPPRDLVPPVLYAVRDAEALRKRILRR